MFTQALLNQIGTDKLSFQLERKDNKMVFTVLPQDKAPEATGAAATAHAALAMPLRIIVENEPDVDQAILSEVQAYMAQRAELKTNLGILTRAMGEASKAVKQETKNKEAKPDKKASPASRSEAAPEKKDAAPMGQTKSLDL